MYSQTSIIGRWLIGHLSYMTRILEMGNDDDLTQKSIKNRCLICNSVVLHLTIPAKSEQSNFFKKYEWISLVNHEDINKIKLKKPENFIGYCLTVMPRFVSQR